MPICLQRRQLKVRVALAVHDVAVVADGAGGLELLRSRDDVRRPGHVAIAVSQVGVLGAARGERRVVAGQWAKGTDGMTMWWQQARGTIDGCRRPRVATRDLDEGARGARTLRGYWETAHPHRSRKPERHDHSAKTPALWTCTWTLGQSEGLPRVGGGVATYHLAPDKATTPNFGRDPSPNNAQCTRPRV